jgi:hypothetical protein
MNVLLHIFGMACGIGAATLATVAGRRWHGLALAASGFGIAAWWTGFERIVSPGFVGLFLVAVAGLHLTRSGFHPLAAFASGCASGVWVPVLRVQGMDVWPALALALAVPVAAIVLTLRHPMFVPLPIYEEALLVVGLLGLVLASGPQIADGWRSAGTMNLRSEGREVAEAARWVVVVGVSALISGGCFSLWWRRR